jgi:hypothetical protein
MNIKTLKFITVQTTRIKKLFLFIGRQIGYIYIFLFDRNYKRLILYCTTNRIVNKNNRSYFIFDNFQVWEILLFRFQFFINFCKLYSCNIGVFNLKRDFLFKKIYSSMGVTKNFNFNNLTARESLEIDVLFKNSFYKICSKDDLFKLKLLGINIGIDIYESYLIRFHQPTLDINDPRFKKLFIESLKILIYWKNILNNYDIKGVYVSHRSYIETNILAKLSYNKKIPVFTNNGAHTKFAKHENEELDNTKYYKSVFSELTQEEKTHGIKISKERLRLKFEGKIGVDMSYSEKTAFHNIIKSERILKSSKKIKVLICTHCFYDNPQAYGGLLFLDFYEWLLHLSKISFKTDYDWYIKPHPDYLPGTLEILKTITKKFNNIKLINPDTSFFQLAKEGLDFALTCHGTIAQELPLLGINVINADTNNPHCAFNFSYTPKSLNDYENTLLNLGNFISLLNNKEQIYEFYYMSNFYLQDKNLFFKNYDDYLFYKEKNSTSFTNFFLKNFMPNKEQFDKKIEYFLKYKKKYTLPDKKLEIIMNYES